MGSFGLLVEDLQRLLQFVEPSDANLATYSHRSYELILRTCTEWESLCKEVLCAINPTLKPAKMNVRDYRALELETHFKLEPLSVGLLFWSPTPRYVNPFSGWKTRDSARLVSDLQRCQAQP